MKFKLNVAWLLLLIFCWETYCRCTFSETPSCNTHETCIIYFLDWLLLWLTFSNLRLNFSNYSQTAIKDFFKFWPLGRYTLLSNIISRVFQRWLIQTYKRCERFVSVNWGFSQFSTSSPTNSLPVRGTLLRQNKSTLGCKRTKFWAFWNFYFIRISLYIW